MMRILFDQGVPRGLAASLRIHEVTEARQLKWERISNGALLTLAENAGFNLLITTDKNLRYHRACPEVHRAAVASTSTGRSFTGRLRVDAGGEMINPI
jgi:hypothetical protein